MRFLAMPFTSDLGDIAAYYKEYEAMMTHWTHIMPGVLHEVVYEDLVQNPVGVIKKLLVHCGLSPAAGGEVFPVRRNSVDKWRSFGPYINDLLKEFA
jgi:hypothetical protein